MRARNVAVAALAVSLFGFLLKENCAPHAWGASAQTYFSLCYSDLGPLFYLRGFADGLIPYLDSYNGQYLEYPVLLGLWMWLTNLVATALDNPPQVGAFVHLTWLASAAMVSATAYLIWRMQPRRAWWFALSPALLLALGVNWDALPVLLSVAALYAWHQGRFGLAGLWAGLGAAAKLYPALLVVPMLFALVERRDWRASLRLAGAAAGAWLLPNLAVGLVNPDGVLEFYRFSRERGVDFGSLWLALQYLFGIDTSTQSANLYGLVAIACAVVTLWFLRNRLDVATAAFVLVSVFCIFNKVYSPQYWLWLTPLLALASVRLLDYGFWHFTQTLYFIAIWRYLLGLTDATASGAIDATTYSQVILLTWGTTLITVLVAVRLGWKSATAARESAEEVAA